MARKLLLAAALLTSSLIAPAQGLPPQDLPANVYAQGAKNHVQGIVCDTAAGRMYFSFTTSLIKTDLSGNVLATVEKIQGHLGAMTFNPEDRKVYASLECKDDAIGASLSSFAKGKSMFYVAIIDVDKLDKVGMSSEGNDAFKIVCIKEAGADYAATCVLGGEEVEHRYGCSGIDGITIAPKLGRKGGKSFLYTAYGIYGDPSRTDNDHQVLLRYDLKKLNEHAGVVRFGDFYSEGPVSPEEKYFVFTGNTNWGVQNLAYDAASGKMMMAVYKGKKPAHENHDLYAFDLKTRPARRVLEGVSYDGSKHPVIGSSSTPVQGWSFKWGSCGLFPVGEGLFYIAENGKTSDGRQKCDAHLYRWTGAPGQPFERQ